MAIPGLWPALALAAAPVAGEPAVPLPAATATVQLAPQQIFALADRLEREGRREDAERLLALLAGDRRTEVRNEARFRQARLLRAQGRDRAAAVLLRRILDEQPGAGPVRLSLASMLQAMGDEGAALRELRALRTLDLPADVARFVDRLSASLQAAKPFGAQLELALAPDSNINRSTRSDTLGTIFGDFAIDQEAKSGIGLAVRGLARARLPLSHNVALSARASGEANLYRHRDFNDIAVELSAGPEMRFGSSRVGVESAIGQQWYGMKPYQRSLRLAANVTRPVDAVSQARLDLGVRWADNRVNDLQDGRGLSARLRYERALSPTLLVSAHVGGDRYRASDDAYSTRSWSAGLAAYREVGRMTLFAGAEYGRLKADERLALLPEAREDTLTRFHLGAVFRQLTVAGFAPMTRFVVERNKSTIEFYDYKRTRTEFGISRAF